LPLDVAALTQLVVESHLIRLAKVAELDVPVIATLETQFAARYDHYSDFGSTVNPKIALRWQPIKTLLVRGSWGTGYRAPSLPDLYTPRTRSHSPLNLADPVRCPITDSFEDCGAGFTEILGGDVRLQPEKSSQYTLGLVAEPVPGISASLDYWNIRKTNVIGSLDGQVILDNLDRFGASNVIRGPADPAYPGLPGPILALIETNANISNLQTSGIDIDLRYRGKATPYGRVAVAFAGTYIIDFRDQLEGFHGESSVGVRWRHHVAVDWSLGAWGVTLAETYSSSYQDANLDAARNVRDVGAYDVWDLQARYNGVRNLTVALGVLNLLDRAPPFSNQRNTFQVGYDPSYANPLGRTFYARLTYDFH
jgi:iron complex outermembrane receptor protein